MQQDVIILIYSYYPILFQIREETLSRCFVNLSYFIRRIRKRILFLLEIHFPTKNIIFTSLSLSNSYVAFKFSKYKTIDLSPPPPFLKPFLYQNFINFPFPFEILFSPEGASPRAMRSFHSCELSPSSLPLSDPPSISPLRFSPATICIFWRAILTLAACFLSTLYDFHAR